MRRIMIAGVVLLAGCATQPSYEAARIKTANETMVAHCMFIETVQGTSQFSNATASIGINNAKNEAAERAAKLGATHMVVKNTSVSWGTLYIADA